MGCHHFRCCCELTAVCSANDPSSETASSFISFTSSLLYFVVLFFFLLFPLFPRLPVENCTGRPATAWKGGGSVMVARTHKHTHVQRSTSCHLLFFFCFVFLLLAFFFLFFRAMFDAGPAEPPPCVRVSVLVLQSNFLVKVIVNADNHERHFFLFFYYCSTPSCSLFFR